jgi:hypothetical protein
MNHPSEPEPEMPVRRVAPPGDEPMHVPSSQEQVIAAALVAVLGQVRAGLDAVHHAAENDPRVREALRAVRESASRLGREGASGGAGADGSGSGRDAG